MASEEAGPAEGGSRVPSAAPKNTVTSSTAPGTTPSAAPRTTPASYAPIKKGPGKVRRLLSSKSLGNLSFAQRKVIQEQQPEKKEQQQNNKPQTKRQLQQKQQSQEKKMSARQSMNIVDGDYRTMRDIDRPAPGDPSARSNHMSQAQKENSRRRSSYFEEALGTSRKDGSGTQGAAVLDRVRSEAIVMAEVKTNVMMNDEFTFITELSYQLSFRFQRPVSSIVVTIQHGICMMFGGTFEPAYAMAIYALPGQVQGTINRRNAVMIQRHMEDALGVTPARGILRFVATPEENMAFNGKTCAGEITELAKEHGIELNEDLDVANKRMSRMKNRISIRQSFAGSFNPKSPSIQEITPPASASGHAPPVPALTALPPAPQRDEYDHRDGRHGGDGGDTPPARPRSSPGIGRTAQEKKTKRRKSFVASIFGWKGDEAPPLPH